MRCCRYSLSECVGSSSFDRRCFFSPDGICFPVARSVTLSTLFNLADRNRICLNGETPNDVQAGQRQTSFSGRGDAHLRRTVNKFQRPSILQLNIEGLTASKMSVLHHLALQCEALVILLQETHCTSVERLDLPSYHLLVLFLLMSFCYKVISTTWLSRAHTPVYYHRFYIFKCLAYEVSCLVTLKSHLGLEAMMSRLGRFGPRSSSAGTGR